MYSIFLGFSSIVVILEVMTRFADPHHFNADPDLDPSIHFNADPDPTLQFN